MGKTKQSTHWRYRRYRSHDVYDIYDMQINQINWLYWNRLNIWNHVVMICHISHLFVTFVTRCKFCVKNMLFHVVKMVNFTWFIWFTGFYLCRPTDHPVTNRIKGHSGHTATICHTTLLGREKINGSSARLWHSRSGRTFCQWIRSHGYVCTLSEITNPHWIWSFLCCKSLHLALPWHFVLFRVPKMSKFRMPTEAKASLTVDLYHCIPIDLQHL